MAEIVATNVVPSRPPNGDRLQRRPLVPISNKPSKQLTEQEDDLIVNYIRKLLN